MAFRYDEMPALLFRRLLMRKFGRDYGRGAGDSRAGGALLGLALVALMAMPHYAAQRVIASRRASGARLRRRELLSHTYHDARIMPR